MDNWMTLCFCILAAAFCALVTATDDASESIKERAVKGNSYLPHHELDQWSRVIRPVLPQIKRYKGDSKTFHYGDLIQYLNSVGKRSGGSGERKRRMENIRYSELIDYLNSVGKRGDDKLVTPGTAVNNPYFRRFEDAMKFEDLKKYLQRVGR